MRSSAKGIFAAIVAMIASSTSAHARYGRGWLALPPNNPDYSSLFSSPDAWKHAAKYSDTFSISATEVSRLTTADLQREDRVIRLLGLKLDIGMSALPVNKQLCGGGLEGMVWPGEPLETARRLQRDGILVDSFSFDLPLTNGHFSTAAHACHFSISEVAERLSSSMRALHSVYPSAKFIDVEVPTGLPRGRWEAALTRWLNDMEAHDERFSALLLDIWWEFPWKTLLANSEKILHSRSIKIGTYLDADRGTAIDANQFAVVARRNGCAVESLSLSIDYFVIANWMVPDVPLLPDTSPRSLLSLAPWAASDASCPGVSTGTP